MSNRRSYDHVIAREREVRTLRYAVWHTVGEVWQQTQRVDRVVRRFIYNRCHAALEGRWW